MTETTEKLLVEVLERISSMLPESNRDIDWSAPAYRWVTRVCFGTQVGRLEPVASFASVDLDRLLHVEQQKEQIVSNTEQFVKGLPANNVLLTGARGTGKSSLIRGCLTRFYPEGLRLIEVSKEDLRDLADIVKAVAGRPEKFILFCDDLSFELGEGGYKALKAALDGSVASGGDNIVIYATSNRRHLMPEPVTDNDGARLDAEGEKLSLAERFGLWLSFYPFTQEEYLAVVRGTLEALGTPARLIEDENTRLEATQFAIQRGGRSGRVAVQFARSFAGRAALGNSGR